MNYQQHLLPPGLEAGPAVTAHAVMPQPYLLANGMQASLLELDPQTGFVRLLKHWIVEDCGRVINPLLADEQLRGGVVQGLGAALYEEMPVRRGRAAPQRLDGRLPGADGRRDARHRDRPRRDAGGRDAARRQGHRRGRAPSAPRPRSATRSTTRWRRSAPRCWPALHAAAHPGGACAMRIVECRERTVGIGADMRNASIGFGAMTASALALVSDRGLTGYAFDSIGRYGKGALLRERFIPRLLRAKPEALLDGEGAAGPRGLRARRDGRREAGRPRRAARGGRPDRGGGLGPAGEGAGPAALAVDCAVFRKRKQNHRSRCTPPAATSAPTTSSPSR